MKKIKVLLNVDSLENQTFFWRGGGGGISSHLQPLRIPEQSKITLLQWWAKSKLLRFEMMRFSNQIGNLENSLLGNYVTSH